MNYQDPIAKVRSRLKVFLFDFDGTICDSYQSAIHAINQFSDLFGYRKVNELDLIGMKKQPLNVILKESGISILQLPMVVRKVRKELQKHVREMSLFPGMGEALKALREDGYKVGVLSSNSKENISLFAAHHQLSFDFIYSGASLFGKGRMIQRALKVQGLQADEVIYVGDESRDIEAAKSAGIAIISVTWGYNSRELLEKFRPEFIFENPEGFKTFNGRSIIHK